MGELFCEVNSFKFAKGSIIDARWGLKYASEVFL